jgi:hypothetical protein
MERLSITYYIFEIEYKNVALQTYYPENPVQTESLLTTNSRLNSQTARIDIRHPAQTPLYRSIFYVVISTYTVA